MSILSQQTSCPPWKSHCSVQFDFPSPLLGSALCRRSEAKMGLGWSFSPLSLPQVANPVSWCLWFWHGQQTREVNEAGKHWTSTIKKSFYTLWASQVFGVDSQGKEPSPSLVLFVFCLLIHLIHTSIPQPTSLLQPLGGQIFLEPISVES